MACRGSAGHTIWQAHYATGTVLVCHVNLTNCFANCHAVSPIPVKPWPNGVASLLAITCDSVWP